MIIDRSKMIPDAVHFKPGKEPVVFFDLDATVIGTVFTNAEPKSCMRFYKKSVTDNRYSVLRPGIPELLTVIRDQMHFRIAMMTDAKYKRAFAILTQFGILDYFDFIISQECLDELEQSHGISRFCKPLDVFGGVFLFDDRDEAREYNQARCALVPPFLAHYDEQDSLLVCGSDKCFVPYTEAFVQAEAERVRGWAALLAAAPASAGREVPCES